MTASCAAGSPVVAVTGLCRFVIATTPIGAGGEAPSGVVVDDDIAWPGSRCSLASTGNFPGDRVCRAAPQCRRAHARESGLRPGEALEQAAVGLPAALGLALHGAEGQPGSPFGVGEAHGLHELAVDDERRFQGVAALAADPSR